MDVKFLLKNPPFEQRVSGDLLAHVFVSHANKMHLTIGERLAKIFEEFGQYKKNPMHLSLRVRTSGLVMRTLLLNDPASLLIICEALT